MVETNRGNTKLIVYILRLSGIPAGVPNASVYQVRFGKYRSTRMKTNPENINLMPDWGRHHRGYKLSVRQ